MNSFISLLLGYIFGAFLDKTLFLLYTRNFNNIYYRLLFTLLLFLILFYVNLLFAKLYDWHDENFFLLGTIIRQISCGKLFGQYFRKTIRHMLCSK